MKKAFLWLVIAMLGAGSSFSLAADRIKVVTTLPDLAWAARQIGGEHVEVVSLLKGVENPHFADAVPRFIHRVADAQVVCQVGMDLEVGWMPKVLAKSGNANVQAGGPGFCETGRAVKALELPSGPVDRSLGDVHPKGNPHYWVSPKALAEGAAEIAEALTRVDSAHAADYAKGLQALRAQLDQLLKENQARLAPLLAQQKGSFLIEYHREFTYFIEAYGLKSFGSIEEKPGVPPSAGRLASVALSAKNAGVKFVLAATYSPHKTLERFSELSSIPAFEVAVMSQPDGKIKDYPQLQKSLVDAVVQGLGGK